MFTSGSSGRPKPVAVPHRGVVRLAVSDPALCPPVPGERVLHAYGLSSDASTIEIWSALLGGATLVLVDRETLLAPAALEAFLRRQRVHLAYLTTGVFHLIARTRPGALSSLRWASAGGEALDPDLTRSVLAACPDTTVVNLYGPTENTVVSTYYVVRDVPQDACCVPIGIPIGNSTYVVVCEDGQIPAPGVEGELLVGGDGLALGYPGLPELTAERFVDSPVTPGVRMYRTGDRAVCRADGNLEFRGRRDRQVKLRGHRVELEDIESRLRADPAIGQVVVELLDGAVTAFVTPARGGNTVRTQEVRVSLAKWLPSQVMPSRVIVLPHFPVNPAGKVDRRQLLTEHTDASLSAPQPDTCLSSGDGLTDALGALWQQVLRVRPVPSEGFFALGGDSLRASEVVTRTLTVAGLDVAHSSALIRALLDNPPLESYARTVATLQISGDPAEDVSAGVDFVAEARHEQLLAAPRGPRPQPTRPQEVLLTGATGFVGAFVLDRLLRDTQARVHYPVRARDRRHAQQRVQDNLARYGLRPNGIAERVVCTPADLAAPGLGLDTTYHGQLTDTLDLVFHAAAAVNFLYPYAALPAANVTATRRVIQLAAPRLVPVHFVSTIAVLAGFGTAGIRRVNEGEPLAHADRLTWGTRRASGSLKGVLRDASTQGLPVTIHRPYEVTGEQRTGVCNTETAICSLFHVIAATGLAPDIQLPMDFVPVDYLANAIVHLALNRENDFRVYHLTNPRPARLTDMLDRMRAAGYSIPAIPYHQWVAELVRYVAVNPTCPTAPYVSLCVDCGNKTDKTVKEMYIEGTFPALGRTNVDHDLAGSGLQCPPVDTALLDRYLEYFFTAGFLARPEVRHTSPAGMS